MSMQKKRTPTTCPNVTAHKTKAALNPATQEPVGKNVVNRIKRTLCYDKDPADPWKCRKRLNKSALSAAAIAARLEWGQWMLGRLRLGEWWATMVI